MRSLLQIDKNISAPNLLIVLIILKCIKIHIVLRNFYPRISLNPYLYENSRRLRRQIRQLRHEYNQRRIETHGLNRNINRIHSSRQNRNQQRRNVRHHLNNEARLMRHLYNESQVSLDDELMFHIET